ncbi:metallophosphoesterase [Dysosmobacter sp.]|uniref:metallophosphoesterase n=1 Tax=Dysosmobacter sp. TaxID=2591382 RepID=UPI002A866160|nr:metallophosphoesterase [Dysosmobacter sp.]MDY3282870.1 metallophosphoesterase [Dysosmobacter sp.]
MALYAMGDLHLSLSGNKSMEVFGPAWENYVDRIGESLSQLTEEDLLVLAGDTSWGMSLAEAEADFRFLEQFPCRKLLVKGNHDYWWTTVSKMNAFFREKDFHTFGFLHNNCAEYGGWAVCGTRGWFLEENQKPHNAKVLNRELMRLETSLQSAGERPILCFLHYPPLYQGYECPEILALLSGYHVKQCCYGHLHGATIRRRIEGVRGETAFSLISGDHLGFIPKKICE